MTDNNSQRTSDVELWHSFLKGDANAFDTIYKTYINSLYKYGFNFSQDEALIKDCAHDVFVDLHKYRLTISGTNNIKLYLFKALKNSIITAICKSKKQSQIGYTELPFLYESAYDATLVETETESERVNFIHKAISKLSDKQKEAIYLKFISELGYDEIGELMHLNYQSARNLVHRGLEKLRVSYRKSGSILMFVFFRFF